MDSIIKTIVKQNIKLFTTNPNIEKINVGFTNVLYNINNQYIVKICKDENNEDKFKKEIDFYESNKENKLIPKLYFANIDKKEVPYIYEIIEKVNGVSLYNVWHKYTEEERENIIKQICSAMKEIHSIKGNKYNWTELMKNKFTTIYSKLEEVFNNEEKEILKEAYSKFDKYLESDEFVLIHNDLHFDNIVIDNGNIKIIDFERSIYAPKDFELDIFYRMIRKPWKFASEETEKYIDIKHYKNIMLYIEKYYPELINTKNLYKRLAIYDIIYYLNQLSYYPELHELKNDTLKAAKSLL